MRGADRGQEEGVKRDVNGEDFLEHVLRDGSKAGRERNKLIKGRGRFWALSCASRCFGNRVASVIGRGLGAVTCEMIRGAAKCQGPACSSVLRFTGNRRLSIAIGNSFRVECMQVLSCVHVTHGGGHSLLLAFTELSIIKK